MARYKNRYIIVEIRTVKEKHKGRFSPSTLFSALYAIVLQLYGDFGFAAVQQGIAVKFHNGRTSIFFVRVRFGPHRIIASCLPLIQKIDEEPVTLHTLYTGATLRQCFKFMKKHQRTSLEIAWSEAIPSDKRIMEEEFLNYISNM